MPSAEISEELFLKLNRTALVGKSGSTYGEVRKALTPRWEMVWRDLIFGWVALALVILAVIGLSHRWPVLASVSAAIGAVLVGFTLAYITLFLHEAAHRNLHPDQRWNDVLCNVFVGGIVGIEVRSYREIHWDHHRYFGDLMDSEISYRDPLNLRFIVESLFGIRAAKVMLLRRAKLQSMDTQKVAKTGSKSRLYLLLCGLAFNLALLGILAYLREWAAGFSWIFGILVFFPFFGALRQLLEHRGELPEAASSRAEAIHLATNRIFGDGPIASTLGGAGFNRHLLHHWDPQVSYTRLRDLEDFLLETQAGPYLRERRTTYLRTFEQLFTWAMRS
jgi:fatty acid desaturase